MSTPGRHRNVNNRSVAFSLNLWLFLDDGTDWHRKITRVIINTWWGLAQKANNLIYKQVFLDVGRFFGEENMAKKT